MLGRPRTVEVYRAMVQGVSVPVNADGEKGFGGPDTDLIWIRGNDVEQARRPFRKPAKWKAT